MWESEWKIINTFFNVDYEVIVTINKSDNDAPLIFGCEPGRFQSCNDSIVKSP